MNLKQEFQKLYLNKQNDNLVPFNDQDTYTFDESYIIKEAYYQLLKENVDVFKEVQDFCSDRNSTLERESRLTQGSNTELYEMDFLSDTLMDKLSQLFCYYGIISKNGINKRLNIYQQEVEVDKDTVNIFKISKKLFALLFHASQNTTTLDLLTINKLLLLTEVMLWMWLIPASEAYGLPSITSFNLILKIIQRIYEALCHSKKTFTISPLTTLRTRDTDNEYYETDINENNIPMILQRLKDITLLCLKVLIHVNCLSIAVYDFINVLGAFCTLEIPKNDSTIDLLSFSYNIQTYILNNSLWEFKKCFLMCMKWTYFNLTHMEDDLYNNNLNYFKFKANKATAFLQSILKHEKLNLEILKMVIKHVITQFNDKAEVRVSLAMNVAKILNSVSSNTSNYLIENLFKDTLRFDKPPTRNLTLDIFLNWLSIIFNNKYEDDYSMLLTYNEVDKLVLVINLIENIVIRFNDSSNSVKTKALNHFKSVLGILYNKLKKESDVEFVNQVVKRVLHFVLSEEQYVKLEKLSQHAYYPIRKNSILVIQNLIHIFNLQSTKQYNLDNFELSKCQTSFIKVINLRTKDSNWHLRKLSISILFQLINYQLENNQNFNLFELWIQIILPCMFDNERNILLEIINNSQSMLANYIEVIIHNKLISNGFHQLSFKGLAKLFNSLNDINKVNNNNDDMLLDNKEFFKVMYINRNILSQDLGLAQFIALYSNYIKLELNYTQLFYSSICEQLIQLKDLKDDLIGKQLLLILFNWYDEPQDNEIISFLSESLFCNELPKSWIYNALQLLNKWKQVDLGWFNINSNEEGMPFYNYMNIIVDYKLKYFNQVLKNNNNGDYEQLEYNLILIGEILLIYPQLKQLNNLFDSLLLIVGSLKKHSLTKVYKLPNYIRCHAFLTLSKLALIDEEYINQLIPILAKEIHLDSNYVIQNEIQLYYIDNQNHQLTSSIIIVLSDLCLRYTRLIDPYIPLIADNLRHKDNKVRKITLICLIRLLRMDYLKFKKYLLFKLIIGYIIEQDIELKNMFYFCLIHILLVKDKHLFFDNLIELIMFLNGKFNVSSIESKLFIFNEELELHRRYRHKVYNFVLQHLLTEHKFRLSHLICNNLFQPILNNELDINNKVIENVIIDALHILSSKHIRLDFYIPKGEEQEDEELNNINQKLLTKINLKNIIENILPILIKFNLFLQSIHSPLQKALKYCLILIIQSYKIHFNQLEHIIDITMFNEIKEDMKKFNKKKLKSKNWEEDLGLGLFPNTPAVKKVRKVVSPVIDNTISSVDRNEIEIVQSNNEEGGVNNNQVIENEGNEAVDDNNEVNQIEEQVCIDNNENQDESNTPISHLNKQDNYTTEDNISKPSLELRRNPKRKAKWSPGNLLESLQDISQNFIDQVSPYPIAIPQFNLDELDDNDSLMDLVRFLELEE